MIDTRSPTSQARPRRARRPTPARARRAAGPASVLLKQVPVQRETPWARSQCAARNSRPAAQHDLSTQTAS
ncbi:MAG: hypothetical protein WB821_10285 [Burkholderiaceae bacterium]